MRSAHTHGRRRPQVHLLIEEALSLLPAVPCVVETPCGLYKGVVLPQESDVCVVSILRAADCMHVAEWDCSGASSLPVCDARPAAPPHACWRSGAPTAPDRARPRGERRLGVARALMPDVSVGKILIQRDEVTAFPCLLYSKLPLDIARRPVLLCDPMLATGGSAVTAIKVLVDKGVPPGAIIFVNVVCVLEGLRAIAAAYPDVRVVTGCIDPVLNDHFYICPGLGDFGDRYFGTDGS